ncbi:MAG: hypothetical protein CL946_12925 [Ectothiorhodospiraceae bacterium]|nr:hypothetical protein [Ectothiorhodospiraceae bacterium]
MYKRYSVTFILCLLATTFVVQAQFSPFNPTIECVDDLTFNPGTLEYDPNPFVFTLRIANTTNDTIYDVNAFITLSDNFALADSGDTRRKDIGTNGILPPFVSGDQAPTITWNVRHKLKSRDDLIGEINVAIGGTRIGGRGDSAYAMHTIEIPKAGDPEWTVSCESDTPMLNEDSTDILPSPVTIRAKIVNSGLVEAEIQYAELFYNAANVDTLLTPKRIPLDQPLKPEDSIAVEWEVDFENRTQARNVRFTPVFLDDEDQTQSCEVRVDVPAVPMTFIGCIREFPDLIIYNDTTLQLEPNPFQVTAVLYTAGIQQTNVVLDLDIVDSFGPEIELDPTYPDNEIPRIIEELPLGDSVRVTWQFQISKPNTTGSNQPVEFYFFASSDQIPSPFGCQKTVMVEPGIPVSVAQPGSPADFTLRSVYPNPATSSITVPYSTSGNRALDISLYDSFGRAVRKIANPASNSGEHSVRIETHGLPPGMYFVVLRGDTERRVRGLLIE